MTCKACQHEEEDEKPLHRGEYCNDNNCKHECDLADYQYENINGWDYTPEDEIFIRKRRSK